MNRHRLPAARAVLLLAAVSIATGTAAARPPPKTPPLNLSPPAVSGTAEPGSALSASPGTWDGDGNGMTFSFAWSRCDSSGLTCVTVAGAADPSLTLGSSDVGSTFRVGVIATDSRGSTLAASSATPVVAPAPAPAPARAPSPTTTSILNTSPPTISGTATVGQTLTANPGSWSGSPTSYAYQWLYCDRNSANCKPIQGATSTTYQPVVYDVGGRDAVRVTAANGATSATATSAPAAVVQAASTTVSPTSSGAYFRDDFENGFGRWAFKGSTSQLSTGAGVTGAGATLTNIGSSSGPNASSQLAALYLNPGKSAHASAGDNTWYHVRVFFPTGYQPTTGEWNWIVEWHDDVPTYNECNACTSVAMGVYTDYPVTTGFGKNPRLALRLAGGSTGSIVQKSIVLPSRSLLRGHSYDLVFHFVWSSSPTTGLAEWWVDGVRQVSTNFPTLYRRQDGASSSNGFGLYNYRLSATWSASVLFDHVATGPTRASVE